MALRFAGGLPANAAWDDFSAPGESAHFYHASGFPPFGLPAVAVAAATDLEPVCASHARSVAGVWPDPSKRA